MNTRFQIRPVQEESAFIYAVDDHESLTELYQTLLSAVGYRVRTFNDRKEALESMTNGTAIPNLLVTDCLGGSIPVDEFLNECRALNPNLRILMASGLNKRHMTLARDRKIRFIQKPFSPSEFIEAVQLVLAA